MARTELSFEKKQGHEERTYGGQIRVEDDKSARWSVSERYFRRQRDADGILEYAIRYAGLGVNVFGSGDGKCTVTLPQAGRKEEYTFLIVSGYATRRPPKGYTILGKEYFITADRYGPEDAAMQNHPPVLPRYNLTLRFDKYDLEYAGIQRNEIEDFDVNKRGLDIYFLNSNLARNLLDLPAAPGVLPVIQPGNQNNLLNQPNAGQQLVVPILPPVDPYPSMQDPSKEETAELERRFERSITDILKLRKRLWDTNTDIVVSWWDRVSEAGLKDKIKPEHDPGEVEIMPKVQGSRSMTVTVPKVAGTFALLIEI